MVSYIRHLLMSLDSYEVRHIWREANQPTNILASLAMGVEETILYPNDFPCNLDDAIRNDVNECIYTHM